MVHIEEISDEMAERLKLERARAEEAESQADSPTPTPPEEETSKAAAAEAPSPPPPPPQSSQSEPAPKVSAMFPEPSPGRAMTEKKSVDEVVAELKKSPFFMTELEENDETEALKALAYEGTPLENAADFKERGNEVFKLKRWADAKEFYTKGILILAAEERRRAKGGGQGSAGDDSPEETARQQRAVLESLYVNRAACHLELRNYRSCWLDGAAALRLNDRNLKAYYRSARAFLAVGRLAEADDACARGLALDGENNALRAVARDLIRRSEESRARQAREAERAAREQRRAALVRAALRARQIRTRATAQPPQMEDAGLRLVPDPDDPRSTLSFPAVLLYPAHLQSDFVKAFGETETLADHLAYVLPPPWDAAGEYARPEGVECYMETTTAGGGGLVRVGKKAPLLKMLSGGRVEVVDEVVRFYVVPKARAEAWVREFKVKKAAEKGGGGSG
ncbi:TPR-like protein [Xylariomycetidae sp. FL2044]|nr:TPR-like protein [Xylariomycetidae sp. FL2044]